MFDISWSELVIVGVVALIVIGPKDLPRVMRSLGQMMRKLRQMSREFRSGLDDFVRETELDEVRKSIHHVSNFDPNRQLDDYLDPKAAKAPAQSAEAQSADSKSADYRAAETAAADQPVTAQPELFPDPPPGAEPAPSRKGSAV